MDGTLPCKQWVDGTYVAVYQRLKATYFIWFTSWFTYKQHNIHIHVQITIYDVIALTIWFTLSLCRIIAYFVVTFVFIIALLVDI